MSNPKQVIRELATYALGKKGAQQNPLSGKVDPLERPCVEVPGPSWREFLDMPWCEPGETPRVWMPVRSDRLKEIQQQYPTIQDAGYMERDGHIAMEIPLDDSVPVEFMKVLIDEAHAIVWNKLSPSDRLMIEMADLPYDEPQLMDRLIDTHELADLREAIHQLARRALLLRTKRATDAKIPIGATKMGGKPDLPDKTAWPVYEDGNPLTFLLQLNLEQVAELGSPINGLPKQGLLSIFSVWGWMVEDDCDPHTPMTHGADQTGWTVIVHTPPGVALQRCRTPRGAHSFKATLVEPTPMLSLPNHSEEPPVKALRWPGELWDRFDQMQSAYRALQMAHWFKCCDDFYSHHLLGGYALFQQDFPPGLADGTRTMILQFGTDEYPAMMWGDGGELTIYADASAMSEGRFERCWGTVQGG